VSEVSSISWRAIRAADKATTQACFGYFKACNAVSGAEGRQELVGTLNAGVAGLE
jgi:hypothetical protein